MINVQLAVQEVDVVYLKNVVVLVSPQRQDVVQQLRASVKTFYNAISTYVSVKCRMRSRANGKHVCA